MMEREGLPFSFFDAVDGQKLSQDERNHHYDETRNHEHFKRPLSASEVGCYLSHLRLWTHIADMDQGAALVLEDDAEISEGLKDVLTKLQSHDLSDVYLKLDGVAEGLETKGATKITLGKHKIMQGVEIAPRTTGYIIGSKAAERMLRKRARFFRPVDNDIKHYWEHDVPVWTLSPQMVCEAHALGDESTIEASRKRAKGINPLSRFWKNTIYQYNYQRQRRMHPPTARAQLSEKT